MSGRELSWFWVPWFFEFGYPDLGVSQVKQEKEKVMITIDRVGNFPVPVNLQIFFEDGSMDAFQNSTEVWASGEKRITLSYESRKKVQRVEIDLASVPDNNRRNNSFLLK